MKVKMPMKSLGNKPKSKNELKHDPIFSYKGELMTKLGKQVCLWSQKTPGMCDQEHLLY